MSLQIKRGPGISLMRSCIGTTEKQQIFYLNSLNPRKENVFRESDAPTKNSITGWEGNGSTKWEYVL
jgi:hypothetical protein